MKYVLTSKIAEKLGLKEGEYVENKGPDNDYAYILTRGALQDLKFKPATSDTYTYKPIEWPDI